MSDKCELAKVIIKGRSAVVKTASGAIAFIPIDKLCELSRRLNLCYTNYKCH